MMAFASAESEGASGMPFFGLAPFLRMSLAGTDIRPCGQEMLALAGERPDDANLWMNLSLAMQCLGQREAGLAIQDQALAIRRIYHLAASAQPARRRVLMLMVPGDLSANTPLECLLEDSDIDLIFYYLTAGEPLALPVPEHDVLIVALSESDENHAPLAALETALAGWPKPVINAPQHIPLTGRELASKLLQDVPGLLIPPTLRASREVLAAVACGASRLPDLFDATDFPIIVRPVGSHAGHHLGKMDAPVDLARYLAGVDEAEFFLARFIDYSGKDGLFRKMRVALIDGAPFVCHMGVSSNWMIHYLNAGMYEEEWKREEEASFMAGFDVFAQRHRRRSKPSGSARNSIICASIARKLRTASCWFLKSIMPWWCTPWIPKRCSPTSRSICSRLKRRFATTCFA
jgi:hypothetical protein